METLLVVGTSVAGVLAGAVLDPVGQRVADASRADEEARLARASLYESGMPVAEAGRFEGPADEDRPSPTPRVATHLVPAGPLPARTAVVALVTGALFGAAAHHFGADLLLAPYCVFFAMLVATSTTDLTHRLVPRWIVYPSLCLMAPLLVASSAVDDRWGTLAGASEAGAAAFALFFAIWWFVPRGMGFGDVRLAGTIGLVVGYLSLLHAYLAFLAGFLVGLLFGMTVLAAARSGRRTAIPFAPSLAVGAVIGVLWGTPIAHTLFHTT